MYWRLRLRLRRLCELDDQFLLFKLELIDLALQLLDRLVFLLLGAAQATEILRKVFVLFIEALDDYLLVCGLVRRILRLQSD